jgi:antitoxin component YwqK of YwqJK toxin-antitoxin module
MNGQKSEEINYKEGDLVDETIFKYSYFTGHLKSEKKYKDGKCISGC